MERSLRTDPVRPHPRPLLAHLGILLVVSSLTLGPAASADPSPPGQPRSPVVGSGFWLLAGPDLGSVGFAGDAGALDVEREAMLALRLGGGLVVDSRLRLGMEGRIRAKETGGRTTTVRELMAVAYLFPDRESPVWIKAGLGRLVLDESDIGNRGAGLAWTLGVGRELSLGDRFSLVPFLELTGSSGVEIVQRGSATGFTENPNALQLGLALVLR